MSTIDAEFAELLRAIDRADIAYHAARTAEAARAGKGDRLFSRLMRRHAGRGSFKGFN